ncbi:ERG9 Squalene synthase ERG9 [Candida maltosa Xu316]
MGKVAQLLLHPTELVAVIKLLGFRQKLHPKKIDPNDKELVRSYELLNKTSRSFAAVIEELHPELRDAIMIFYLVLRALDTIEDDMTIKSNVKIPLLRNFDAKLDTKDWTFDGNGPNEKDRAVLVEFDNILNVYHRFKPEYQEIIKDITNKMGNGMADYILDEDFNVNGVATVKDYDLYCHYVAGLVGEGLTRFFVLAKFGDNSLAENNFAKAESMGLFLQKTNIIRDYHEDLEDGRSFWPKEVWGKYTDKLPQFHEDSSKEFDGVSCINELVLNALGHVSDCLEYLSLVKDPSSFSFCAIPQVMAIATLAEVYNNPKVLHGVVKIRKGTTCKLILQSRTFPGVVEIFREYIQIINHKSSVKDPNYLKIGIKCGQIEQCCEMLYPNKEALPANMTTVPENKYTKVIASREKVDSSIQRIIDQENFNFNVVFFGIGAIFASILYYFLH